ncbi:MAG: polyamine aminopropyltransferase [Sulfurimicrobium sp.]|jgi:spermidine synthase|nr:polyamine aminopropyltransferase [Sulfurimicrobium sp.]MDO9191027.1 polyamine aminopropyltransferase [Sulfurimicrobium sp.]MDP1704286.1 polyamine aminopropyltransferase [Sulfurimicrobium sp.]MDP1897852.1 polyamine aminopropyltransferase [Sulfurimicrobium sp.]MDP2198473.1 polyamine aminopropyltransferase [Sulfurimicrobium sp.]
MGFFSKWRTHKAVGEQGVVDVSERDGVRFLHLGSDTVQSAMRVKAPNDLELAYTRAMMGFLLFHPGPRNILMIGLGGGSVAKFVYHKLPSVRTHVVEINPQVVAAARSHFFVPEPDQRLRIEIADGVDHVRNHPASCDVLMVDGYDDRSLVEALASQSFFDDCAAALTPDGVLVVNLWGSDKLFDVYFRRIEASFNGLVLSMPTGRMSNIIVFGFKRSPGNPGWQELKERASKLEADYGLEFPDFVTALRSLNAHSEKRLLI